LSSLPNPFQDQKGFLKKAISYWKKTMFFKHVGKEFGQLKKKKSHQFQYAK